MGAFGGLVLTNRGKNLQSKAQTGIPLNYTRIAMGDGTLGSNSILALNGLISQKKSLNITKLKVQPGGKATVGSVWSNSDLTEGFYFREIGVFAQDPDLGEILYCYGNAGALAEYIPPGGGSDLIERNLDIQTLVGNATNITATIDSSLVYASKSDIDSVSQQLNSHETSNGHVKVGAEMPTNQAVGGIWFELGTTIDNNNSGLVLGNMNVSTTAPSDTTSIWAEEEV
ncbi:phage tail protein [Ureibacillus chungkukjangi]|uniref:phage tail-collar fiber domain-containing protein n=1 Tax=Ureibacillus chungkukjangi TaxID=1202712 RepID=UPI00384E1E16